MTTKPKQTAALPPDPMKAFYAMTEREQLHVIAKAWIIKNDHFLFPLEGEDNLDHHSRILMVYAEQTVQDLRSELKALAADHARLKEALGHYANSAYWHGLNGNKLRRFFNDGNCVDGYAVAEDALKGENK